MPQSEFPWCLQQQPNQQGQETKGNLRWDTCWSLDQHSAHGVVLTLSALGGGPSSHSPTSFLRVPLSVWLGVSSHFSVKTHAPAVENPCLISEPHLNHPPHGSIQSLGPQHVSIRVFSAKDKSLISAEYQRVLSLIHAACTHRIGSRKRNSSAENVPGCLCL